jgi:hypothetical protein
MISAFSVVHADPLIHPGSVYQRVFGSQVNCGSTIEPSLTVLEGKRLLTVDGQTQFTWESYNKDYATANCGEHASQTLVENSTMAHLQLDDDLHCRDLEVQGGWLRTVLVVKFGEIDLTKKRMVKNARGELVLDPDSSEIHCIWRIK